MRVADYRRPASLAEAWRLKAEYPHARFIAGGTDMMVQLRAGNGSPGVLISLRGIDELRGIERDESTRIGSMTTISEILAHPTIGEVYPVLRDAARPFASVQVRNMATIGGNLCNASPAADMAPALLVLDARVLVTGPDGEREMPLDGFFLEPGKTRLASGEVLTWIVIEPPPPGARTAFLRKSRVQTDLALVSVAVLLVMEEDRCRLARVAAGSVAPRPLRLRSVEGALEGRLVEPGLLARARELAEREVSPVSDVRATADYRRHLTGALFQRAVESVVLGYADER
jgi:carbon-monoxide dehydrogenase medium subunit